MCVLLFLLSKAHIRLLGELFFMNSRPIDQDQEIELEQCSTEENTLDL